MKEMNWMSGIDNMDPDEKPARHSIYTYTEEVNQYVSGAFTTKQLVVMKMNAFRC